MHFYTLIAYFNGIHHTLAIKTSLDYLDSLCIVERDVRSEPLIQVVESILGVHLFDIGSDFITFEILENPQGYELTALEISE